MLAHVTRHTLRLAELQVVRRLRFFPAMIFTVVTAIGLYVVAFGLWLLHGIATAIGRAGGDSDPSSYLHFAIPLIAVHSLAMRCRGSIALAVSSSVLAAIYFGQAISQYHQIISHLHPDYIRAFGYKPSFEARQWLAISKTLPTVCLAACVVCLLIPFPRTTNRQRVICDTPNP